MEFKNCTQITYFLSRCVYRHISQSLWKQREKPTNHPGDPKGNGTDSWSILMLCSYLQAVNLLFFSNIMADVHEIQRFFNKDYDNSFENICTDQKFNTTWLYSFCQHNTQLLLCRKRWCEMSSRVTRTVDASRLWCLEAPIRSKITFAFCN